MDGHGSEAGDGLIDVGVEDADVLAAILFGDFGDGDAGILVGCPTHIVGVVLADLVAAIDQQKVGVTHPLLVAAQHDGVEDFIQALAIAGGIELTAADHGVLLRAVGWGEALIIAGTVASAENGGDIAGLGEHQQQIHDGVHQGAAQEVSLIAHGLDGGVLLVSGFAVIRLQPTQGAHLALHDGAVEHGQPYALQFLVVRVLEATRLEAVPLGQGELDDAVIAHHFLALVDLLDPGESAAIIGGIGYIGCAAIGELLGVVVLIQAVVRGAIGAHHPGLVGFQPIEAAPAAQIHSAIAASGHGGVVGVQADVLDALAGAENVHVFDKSEDGFSGQDGVALVEGFLVCDKGLAHGYTSSS